MGEKELNINYHSFLKGCQIEKKLFRVKGRGRPSWLKGGYCETHEKDLCKCGYEWGEHPSFYTIEDYPRFVKDKCQICEGKIPETLESYFQKGNVCLVCSGRIDKKLKYKDSL